jgi:hypothetical protein
MKGQKFFWGTVSATFVLSFAACNNPLQRSAADTEGLAPGLGRAVVAIASGNPRTALPGAVELAEYRVSFTARGAETPAWSGVTSSPSITADLETGVYTITVTGYDGNGAEAATGSGEITISPGTLSGVTIQLGAGAAGTGALRYRLNTGEGTAFQYADLSVHTLPQGGLQREIRFEKEGGVFSLAAGYYRVSLSAFILKDGVMQTRTKTAAAHIYPNQETELSLDIDPYSGALGTEYSAGTAAELDAALTSIKNSGDKNAVINITANFSHAPIPLTDAGYTGKAITIRGADTASIKTISLSGNGSLFTLGAAGTAPALVLSAVKLTGHGSNNAALIKIDGGLGIIAEDAEISGNSNIHTDSNSYSGGGVAVESGARLRIYGGAVKNNTLSSFSGGTGGGVAVRGTLELYGGSIDHNNTAAGSSYGGGVSVESGGLFRIYGGLVQYNSAALQYTNSDRGGGGVMVSGTFEMYGGSVDHNTAIGFGSTGDSSTSASKGGGVYVGSGGVFVLKDGAVAHNTCYYYGGGVYTAGTFTLEGGSVHENTIGDWGGYGGGVYAERGTITLKGGEIRGNAARYGGGVSLGDPSAFSSTGILDGAGIYENTAMSGGGIAVHNSCTLTMQSGAIRDNLFSVPASGTKSFEGAGVYIYQGSMIMNDGIISGNGKVNVPGNVYGGGVSVRSGSFTMNNGSIEDNSLAAGTAAYGGGIYSAGTVAINNGHINNNAVTAPSAYGAGVCAAGGLTIAWAQVAYNKPGAGAGTVMGGGVYTEGAFVFNGGYINGNDLSLASSSAGGGVYVTGTNGSITMNGGSVLGNLVKGSGGGIYFNGGGGFVMREGVIGGNSANQGGGVFLTGGMGGFRKNFSGGAGTCGVIYGSEAAGVDDMFGYDLKNTGTGAAIHYSSYARNTTVDEYTALFHDDPANWTD